EAFLDGKVVATSRNMPSKRKEDISLRIDGGLQPVANGSDIIQVVASVTDKDGHIKRLTQEEIVFEVEGEGVLIGDAAIGANPVSTRWGEAVALIRTTHKPGKIKVTCRTKHPALVFAPNRSVEIETIASDRELVFQEAPLNIPVVNAFEQSSSVSTSTEQIEKALKQVEKQQTQFESTER
ncbi:MAG: glycoside hydrolase family 2, partial [Bacteroidales bacterium]